MVTGSQKMSWYHTLSLRFSLITLITLTEAAADVFLRNSGKVSNLPSGAQLDSRER